MRSCTGSNLSDHHWQFVMHDARQMSIILKISSVRVSNEMLHTIDWNVIFLSYECHRNHEVARIECSEDHVAV